MKTPVPFLSVIALLALRCPAAEFEGTVRMNLVAGKNTYEVTYSIKDTWMRFDQQIGQGPRSAGLFDGKTGEMTVIMTDQKMYMTLGAPKAGLAPDATFEETGRSEEIAGYTCSEFIVRDKKNVIEVWATRELGKMPNLAEAFGKRGRRSAWETYASEKGMFALRVITRDKKGKEASRLECVEVKRGPVDDSLFTVPAGFTKLQVPGLGQLLGQ